MDTLLIYGAYGYTGELVAREAVQSGLKPVLAGRREQPLRQLAAELDVSYRVANLDNLAGILDDVDVCVHCAGPFVATYQPAVETCLATGTHYLDITGEPPVLSGIREYDEQAHENGVMLLPGAGLEVVPSDCLAARLHERLPDATRLTFAFSGHDEISPGTARTAGHLFGDGVYVRDGGELHAVPFGSRTEVIDTNTGSGSREMGLYPFGEVVTAHHTTGIPNIEVYAPDVLGLSPRGQRVLGALQPLFRVGVVKRALIDLGNRIGEEPDAAERQAGSEFFWAEASNGEETVSGRIHTTQGYEFTSKSVVEIVRRMFDSTVSPGFQTPAGAFGSDLVLSVDGSRFEDMPPEHED